MEYKEILLKDLASKIGDGLHGTPSYDPKGDFYFVNGNNLEEGNIVIKDTTKTVNRETFEKYKKDLSKRTLLVSINGTIGKIAKFNNENIVLGKSACYINLNDTADKNYIYFLLKSREFQNYIQQYATGTTIKNVSLKTIRNFKVKLPALKYQNRVSTILQNIENKIQLNYKMIANLEELSQTLFKRWFIDFEFPDENGNPYKSSGRPMTDSELGKIPIDWKVSKIIELDAIVSDHVANGSFKTLKENVEFVNADIKNNAIFVRNIDLKKQDFRPEKYVSNDTYKFLKKTQLHGHELIISNVGDVGSIHLCPKVDKNMVLGNNQIFLKYNIDKKWNYYLYLYFKSDVGKQLINKITSGSVQMKFNKTDFRNLQIVIPTQKILDSKFENIIGFLNLIEEKKCENKRLIELRDTLLPKLMSGEIEIPDDIEVNSDELSI